LVWIRTDSSATATRETAVAAYLLVLLAFQHADAGRVATLRETSVLFGLGLARERTGKSVWVGAMFIVLGAVLSAV
jgi:drug/metabolite transporter (DMT)-like permease